MANYLPVLLVSVGANSIPDDSSLSTLPRGQVDYLSHKWEEEDVWRSWRNMTRQKNEITNGVRLENASWRTWWKQRNGLGTVTPETLNWLKDSDVTWLYGPLHTAVDWSPPPKLDTPTHTSALDLSTTHKPILKHRSISQLLTSYHPAPIFSSTESEEDDDAITPLPPQLHPNSTGEFIHKRPPLIYTKSDTCIARCGFDRAYRKVSPPRIDPPAGTSGEGGYNFLNLPALCPSSIVSSDSFPVMPLTTPAGHQKRRHISFNTFVEQYIAIEKPKKDGGDDEGDDHDDDYFAIDTNATAPQVAYDGRNNWGSDDGYEEDEEADSNDEDDALSLWDERFDGSAIEGSDSDSCDDETVEDEEYGEGRLDNDRITIRSSIHNNIRPSLRSQSLVSSSSASTSTSTDTSSTSSRPPSQRNRSPSSTASQRRFSTSTARPRVRPPPSEPPTPRRRRRAPPLIRTPTTATSNSDHYSHGSPPLAQPTHVTIAPIAPTILKTGGHEYGGSGWVEGFGDEGGSDDGILSVGKYWGTGADKGSLRGSEKDSGGEDEGSPVELVYVPPSGSIWGREREFVYTRQREVQRTVEVMEDHEDGLGHGERGVYRRRHRLFSVGVGGDDEADVDAEGEMDNAAGGRTASPRTSPLPVPTVVVGPEADDGNRRDINVRGRDAYDYFEGPDLGEDPPSRGRNQSGRGRRGSEGERGRPAFSIVGTSSPPLGEAEQSRSRSKSRTPSPAVMLPSNSVDSTIEPSGSPESSPHLAVPARSNVALVRRSASASPPSTQTLLSPPPRGRGSSSQQDLQVHSRGRSSTRNSSTTFDREGVRDKSSVGSPLGSYSPDGVGAVNVGGVYANERVERGRGDRDRERERGGDGERTRGRDRTGKRLSHSLSPDDFPVVSTSPVSVPSAPAASAQAPPPVARNAPPVKLADQVPPIPILAPEKGRAEKIQRTITPTPSNSPVIIMQAVPAAIAHVVSPSNKPPTPTKGRSPPLTVPAPLPAEPSTSYSISPPAEHSRPPPSPSSPRSPRSPTRGEGTIVGKAVEMVSSAGAFLGFWHHGGNNGGAA